MANPSNDGDASLSRLQSVQMPLLELFNGLLEEHRLLKNLDDLDSAIHELQDDLEPSAGIESAQSLLRIAAAYEEKHRRTGMLEDQQASTMLLLESVNAIPESHVSDKLKIFGCSITAHVALFERTQSMDDLSLVIQQLQTMLETASGRDQTQALIFYRLGVARDKEFELTEKMTALDEMIRNYESSLRLTPKSDPEWLHRAGSLFSAAQVKYDRTGQAQDLQTAIRYQELRLDGMPEADPMRTLQLGLLGSLYFDLHHKTKDLGHLEKCIDILEDLLYILPEDHTERPTALLTQARAYVAMWQIKDEVAFLEVAARQLKQSLDRIPADDPIRKSLVPFAAGIWHHLYGIDQGGESLETSLTLYEEELGLLSNDSPERPGLLRVLADLAFDKGKRTLKAVDITAATARLWQLQRNMSSNNPERQRIQRMLLELIVHDKMQSGAPPTNSDDLIIHGQSGLALRTMNPPNPHRTKLWRRLLENRAETKDAATTQQWVQESEDFLQNMSPDDPWHGLELLQLGMSYVEMYQQSKGMQHLDQAIKCYHQGLSVESGNKHNHDMLLHGLATALWIRYGATELEKDLNVAIETSQKCLASDIDPLSQSQLISTGLLFRYSKTGKEADLDLSLQLRQKSLALMPDDDKNRASILHGMGVIFLERSTGKGAFSDLEAGIEHLGQAVQACSAQHHCRSEYLSDLGRAYKARYLRTSDTKDMEMAIQRLQEAVETSEDNTVDRAICSVNLADGYGLRFHFSKATSDLDLAIDYYKKAIHLEHLHGEGQNKPRVLACLGNIYVVGYLHNGDTTHWELGKSCLENAINQMPKDLFLRGEYLWHLGTGYHVTFKRTGQNEDLQKAISFLEEALSCSHYQLNARTAASKSLIAIYSSLEDWTQAYRTASTLFSLIPLIMARSLENSDKQLIATQFVGFASDAAAIALLAGESPYAALRLLETGRGLIMSSLLGLRSDIDDLKQDHPKLAEEYLKFRDQIDSVKGSLSNPAAAWLPVNQPQYRHNAAKELERVIKTVRGLPGFDSFLQEPSEEDMRSAAAFGPIVVINVSQHRCDAIIVEADGIRSECLPKMTMKDIKARSQATTGVSSLKSEVLEWLWDGIVEPVLDSVGLTSSPAGDWPRICWIPTGPLVHLPLHAAGYHHVANKTILDRAISSYSISLTALVQNHTYRQKSEASRKPEHAVLIGMKELHNAPKEIEEVARICQEMQVQRPDPSTKKVLKALRNCDIFHFAGHGSSNALDPSKSALILNNQDPLTVSSLFDINLHKQKPFLAFLSACSTGQIRQDKLVDEGLHLIAGCQVAGFQHVIGTLWEVNDALCIEVARMTYEWMHKNGMSHDSVSEGLHRAIRQLRMKWVRDHEHRSRVARGADRSRTGGGQMRDVVVVEEGPLLWVPYIHYGF
ncbi:CHAT domain-containing protein [Ilyonectria sp. MPI-CAGE-AT-0026]|nr:CHAT domain-containing protein [Ilyonectria sp. MPI-CAGE-AT-0026]